ncbi:phosphoribosylaminoimidazole carboxylase, ATPase subunit [Lichtheimia ornata]|uniref:Phosphoribosylaminoimidazole carboxylase n=1 Tax=Lichtheimia ornata TaxID=688661 RepID=A0AAD7XR33_9FUNG|nr:phosphoribosylaminoimidazole carboxylase, ATPase subunit [Lichtheimia ornata]KAJ8653644.1 phosphoribosylaminoimidazole carboxylase, ATPase subunit [Lichtheimia ornata]
MRESIGGQLGRMMVEAASRLNLSVTILDSPVNSPAKQIEATQEHIHGAFKDPVKIRELASKVDVLTVEIEHVDAQVLAEIEKEGKVKVHPSAKTVQTIQDKYAQKQHLQAHGIPVAEYMETPDADAVAAAGKQFGYPFMLKSKTMAYDGKGNYVVRSADDIPAAMEALKNLPLYAEKWAPFVKELAVMVVRRANGEVRTYPVVETIHKNSICHLVIAPAQADGAALAKAQAIAADAIKSFPGAGIFGVEMFLMENGSILLNEIAPRPHNSGHYTIEACETSQFENHMRAILDMPLGSTEMKVPASIMVNLLGESTSMEECYRPCQEALLVDGATIHLYGKKECRAGRKMGHITVVGESMMQVQDRLKPILKAIEPDVERNLSLRPLVGIIMGSDSDLPVMKVGAKILKDFDIPFELTIVSAHRTPDRMFEYARSAAERGLKAIIAGAGGAAHLPGMVAAMTPLPVIGVPVKGSSLDGVDSLHSIVQMPRGVPVATVAINNSTNAALLAIRMLGAFIPGVLQKMDAYMKKMEGEVLGKVDRLNAVGWEEY